MSQQRRRLIYMAARRGGKTIMAREAMRQEMYRQTGIDIGPLLPMEGEMESGNLNAVVKRIGDWAESTFDHDEKSIIKHMVREVTELALAAGVDAVDVVEQVFIAEHDHAVKGNMKRVAEEGADVFILLAALFNYMDADMYEEVIGKHGVNVMRIWGPKDEHGVSEHIGDMKP
jgi:NTP pyrophosphatase (non-canonical NTP hydrolase)